MLKWNISFRPPLLSSHTLRMRTGGSASSKSPRTEAIQDAPFETHIYEKSSRHQRNHVNILSYFIKPSRVAFGMVLLYVFSPPCRRLTLGIPPHRHQTRVAGKKLSPRDTSSRSGASSSPIPPAGKGLSLRSTVCCANTSTPSAEHGLCERRRCR